MSKSSNKHMPGHKNIVESDFLLPAWAFGAARFFIAITRTR